MTQQLHFMIGLPRSGSTVLCALLNQNADIYVTPTSPLLGYLLHTQNAYEKVDESVANPNFDQLTTICRAMMQAAWSDRPETHIIDKHRGWGKNLNAVETVTGKMPKVIATTRDLPSVMASWLTLIKKYPYNFDARLLSKGLATTDENRMGEMWFNMTKDTMESLVMAKQTAKSLYLVDYDEFMADPIKTLRDIEEFLECGMLEDYDLDNIQKLEEDNDMKAWGFPELHKIRPKFGKTSGDPKAILGDELYNRFVQIGNQYDYR